MDTYYTLLDIRLEATSDEVAAARETVMSYYNKPLLPSWHALIAEESSESVAGEPAEKAETADAV